MDISADRLFTAQNNLFHYAIALIALALIATVIYELKKPHKDPNRDNDTKRMNDILND